MISTQLYDMPGGNLILDLTDRVQSPRLATNERGYHDWSGFVPMDEGDAFRWYDFAGGHLVVSVGAIVVYQGRVEDPEVSPAGLQLTAFGYSQAYSDTLITMLMSTKRTDRWEQIVVDQLSSRSPERFAISNDGVLRIAPQSGEAFDTTHIGSLTDVIPHNSARQLLAVDFDFNTKLISPWTASLSRFTDDFTFQSTVWTSTSTGTGTQNLVIAACDRLVLNLYYDRARTTLGAATNGVSTTLGTTTLDVSTTLGTNVAAPGSVSVTPPVMTGITVGRKLIIGGTNEEEVTVTATPGGTQFTATFAFAHNSTDPVTLGTNSVTVAPPSMAGIGVGDALDIGGSKPEIVEVTAIAPTTFTALFVNAHASTDPVQLVGLIKRTPALMTGIAPGVQLLIGNNGGATRSQAEVVTVLTTTPTAFIAEYQYSHHANDTISYVYQGETDVDVYVKLSNVRLKTTTSATVDLSEIAAALVSYVDGINPTQINAQTTALIQSTGRDEVEAVFEDMRPSEILSDLCAKGDSSGRRWDWSVYEYQHLRVAPEGFDGQTWYVDAAPPLLRSLGGIENEQYALYRDPFGRVKRTSVAIDAGSVQAFGIRRRGVIDTQSTSLAEAELIRTVALNDKRYNGSLGEFVVKALRTVDGAIVPGWYCRQGDRIIVRGYPAGSASSIDYIRWFPVFATDFAYGQPGDRRGLGTLKIVSTRLPVSLPGLLARKG